MRFRRIAAAALVAAIALVPFTGHAVLEEKRTVPGSICTVGNELLTFDANAGLWIGTNDLDCANAAGEPLLQLGLSLNFVLFQVQGVNTFQAPYVTGPAAMSSQADPQNPAATLLTCANCSAIQAQGRRGSLAPGLYVMYSQATVQQSSGLRRGSHTSCFLVQGDVEGPAQKIPGCAP